MTLRSCHIHPKSIVQIKTCQFFSRHFRAAATHSANEDTILLLKSKKRGSGCGCHNSAQDN